MKRITTLILSLSLFGALAFGQSPEKLYAGDKSVKQPTITMPATDSLSRQEISTIAPAPVNLPSFYLNDSLSQKVQQLPKPVFSRGPFFINEQFSVALGKSSYNFKYENITSFGTSFLFRPLNKLTFEVSPVIAHYFFGNKQLSPFTDFSCSFGAQYNLSEKVAVKAFGQVSASTNTNKFYGYAPFVPQNAYGVGLKYKANKNLSFEVSVEQSQYNGMWYNEHNGMQTTY
ncbi:hypothetical protein [Paludibacter jiangxiensis]|uniref:Outer membrane protein beta-barrel domain-containing protein n=1 Tax=Paludibacter jiangxiensis TaxID=681398 RepID=A0A170ZXR4_9BACT|nr:hypothetical protein [Paludibacter jiangxiensis]GAT63120.1 hypothetical protein PJIAN_3434 [Paludibacter jiangxiensis]